VVIIVAAIVYSKRRSSGMGEETPQGTEISGATSPAASVGSAEATVSGQAVAADATANAVPSAHPAEEAAQNGNGNGNGHVASGSPQQADSAPGQQGE
jgi:hypothetical protein